MLSLAAPEAAAQTLEGGDAALAFSCLSGGNSGDFEVGVVMRPEAGLWTIVMTNMETGVELAGSRRTISSETPAYADCQYYAYFDSAGGAVPDRVQLSPDVLYRIDMFPAGQPQSSQAASYYYSLSISCAPGSRIFCPVGSTGGQPDTVFFIGTDGPKTYIAGLTNFGQGPGVEGILSTWVMPYDVTRYCALSPTNCSAGNRDGSSFANLVFLTPAPAGSSGPATLPIQLHAATGADWRVPAGRTYTWSSADVSTVTYGSGGRVTVNGGTLNATGLTLTAGDAGLGWSGLSVPGGVLSLSGSAAVAGVRNAAAVTITAGGRATLDGATVRETVNGSGVYVSGANSSAIITGVTNIRDNASGPGVRVDAGGAVSVAGEDVQVYGNAGGIVATGSGSHAQVSAGHVRNNTDAGLRATAGARIDVLRAISGGSGSSLTSTSTQPVRLTLNRGGLYATAKGWQPGGVVNTEAPFVCVQAPCPVSGQHSFVDNNGDPNDDVFDAAARSGSQVLATHNYWGTSNREAIETDADESSEVVIDPILTAPPSALVAAARAASGGLSDGASRAGGASGYAPTLSLGLVDAGVQALIAEADAWVPSRDSVRAGARLMSAWALTESSEDRLAVAEAAGRALAAVQPPALVAWAAGAAASTGADRPWGRRALARSLAGQGHYAEASVVAQALASEDGAGVGEWATMHRARGLGLRVEFAVASGDAPGAVSALHELADVDPEGAADLALSVAVAFPDADVSLVQGRSSAGRGTAPGKTPGSVPMPENVAGLDLTAGPNPSSGAVRVSLVLPAEADATVIVFDALGRQMAVLHAGAATAGTLATSFDGATLPAGIYVVRAVVRSSDGSSAVLARRVVIAH